MSPASTLRQRLQQPNVLVVPGAGSPLDVRLIEQKGFEAAYVSGYATAAQRFGVPDVGLIAYAEIEDMVKSSRAVSNIPLIVDCDTGYGGTANVRQTIRRLEALGVAAIQIEDQLWPKRCGHMDGKLVEDRDTAVTKVRAAVAARQNTDTVIVARSDARGPHGLEEALERCHLFKAEGADVLFVDGPESAEELEKIGANLPGPLIANMSESGKTPLFSAEELSGMGFSVVLFPSSLARLNLKCSKDFLEGLRENGDSRAYVNQMATLDETNRTMGINDLLEFDEMVTKEI
ncbi:isocitrate lyase/PEP mutase family protein [Fodinicurvata fenggangensis]|uniref:isocitrate lyase/PEP mutase family protein n=1 Tax=Fodinicurvata fenggangensis TaxID=1121830 RepID=UPI00047B3118|nr:isocitrate lyase/PEP mutase family protein [Fodinicurvata fenggangensis]